MPRVSLEQRLRRRSAQLDAELDRLGRQRRENLTLIAQKRAEKREVDRAITEIELEYRMDAES